MKKVFLTLTLAAFAFAANAQIFVGANLGFHNDGRNISTENKTTSGSEVTDANAWSNTWFLIMPKIGYQINDKMSAGLTVGFRADSFKDYTWASPNAIYADWEGVRTTSWNTISISPFFRYNVVEFGDLKLFVEARIPVTLESVEKWNTHETYTDLTDAKHDETAEGDNKTSTMTFGISVIPGFSYNLTDNISVDVYINAISLAYTHSQEKYNNPDAPVYGTLNRTITDNDFTFGCNTLGSGITVGFNYAF